MQTRPNERSSLLPSRAPGTKKFPFNPASTTTSLWRRIFFSYFDGHEKVTQIDDEDIWALPEDLQSANMAKELREALKQSDGSLWKALWKMNAGSFKLGAFFKMCFLAGEFMQPLLIYLVPTNLMLVEKFTLRGICGMLIGSYVIDFVHNLLLCHARYHFYHVQLKVVSSLRAAIYNQVMLGGGNDPKPNGNDEQEDTKKRLAEVADMYRRDAGNVGMFVADMHTFFSSVLLMGGNVFFLVHFVVVPFDLLVVVLAVFGSVLMIEVVSGQRLTDEMRSRSAGRVNAVHECFKRIQSVKLNGWEDKMEEKINHAREIESAKNMRRSIVDLIRTQLCNDLTSIVAVFTFGAITSREEPLTAEKVFMALLIFRQLEKGTNTIKYFFDGVIRTRDSVHRLNDYLQGSTTLQDKTNERRRRASSEVRPGVIVEFRNAFVGRSHFSTTPLLMNVSLRIHQGELIVIRGKPGVGKSALLATIRQESNLLHGKVSIMPDCTIGYFSQEPWLQTLSIQDNILFGSAYDERKYWCVLDACGLLDDLKALPAGDQTLVGPRGINLSGGQKARIALARACYADADLYLLDCPLASVDAMVQSEVFQKCVLQLLLRKTVVWVTHNPEVIGSSYVDQVIDIEDMTASSSAADGDKPKPSNWCSRRMMGRDNQRPGSRFHPVKPSLTASATLKLDPLTSEAREAVHQIRLCSKRGVQSILRTTSILNPKIDFVLFEAKSRQLFILASVCAVMWLLAAIAKDIWILHCADKSVWPSNDLSAISLATTYLLLVLGCVVFGLFAGIFQYFAFFEVAQRLFSQLNHALLQAPMGFFYQTPMGELLDRFLNDTFAMDHDLHIYGWELITATVALMSSVLVICYCVGVVGLLILALSVVAFKRLASSQFFVLIYEKISQPRMKELNFLSETIDGEAVVRAFGNDQIARLVCEHADLSDTLQKRAYLNFVFKSFIMVRTANIHGITFLLIAGILTFHEMTPAELGLTLYCIFLLHDDMATFTTCFINFLIAFDSAKRVHKTGKIKSEQETAGILPMQVEEKWPSRGDILFDQVFFKYDNGKVTDSDTYALRDVSFSLRGGEKIGVIGRTGSGKSSIAMALLRVHPLARGRILIDGIDISGLGLKTLRSRLTVIPQTTMFYRCSVRDYLDPFGEHHDVALWHVVQTVGLCGSGKMHRQCVASLDDMLGDDGENWSLGERQLLCFARALLQPSRVLLLDEAFSSLDQDSESMLMRVLATKFASSTVFLITHRVDQVLNFDRILVMSGGVLVESGDARELAGNPHSAFYEFLETTLLTM
ncbi:hypothetical protein Poli38472_002515 [Pythium oligandrum]|uniref:Uncharacterized protein n=1 Tax=Pythium oligandrum TaxID=41045 RepID=A0A8K1CIA7_PYTOL|nr:hypothetical protein Poli38472_002515 [Pythium oligandrum]|eukprot:TMW63574.1 hypothetical protein Poli38472_002515 [Pythium oligandrum]